VQNIQWARVSVWAENCKELALNIKLKGRQNYVQIFSGPELAYMQKIVRNWR